MKQFSNDASAMRLALQLAEQGLGFVEPNPPVGAVITNEEGMLLGCGYHQEFGGPHAEIHAMQEAGSHIAGATLYVTLEPCSHLGKTPPCAQAVIQSGIRNVVIATEDLSPHVNGEGIRLLKEAGITIKVGVLQEEALQLMGPYFKRVLKGQPWVHAKWAMTLDGKIATANGHSQWISNETSRQIVHQLRGRMDGILIGIQTAELDNPLLTARPSGPRIPTRIVIDPLAEIPIESQLVQSACKQTPVLIAVCEQAPTAKRKSLQQLDCEVMSFPTMDTSLSTETSRQNEQSHIGNKPRICWNALLEELGNRGMTNILVEGGAGIFGSLNDTKQIDEFHIFVAPKLVGDRNALSPLGGIGVCTIPEEADLEFVQFQDVAGDLYLRGISPHIWNES